MVYSFGRSGTSRGRSQMKVFYYKTISLDLDSFLLELNHNVCCAVLPEGMTLRSDGYLVKQNADHTVGLSSSPRRLARFFSASRFGDMSSWSVLDAGAFIGDAAAFFSTWCKSVVAVERDQSVQSFACDRLKQLHDLGYAHNERISWSWGDYFSKDIPFSGYALVYNYFDQYSKEQSVLPRLMAKFSDEADRGALLVLQLFHELEHYAGPLIYRSDLSLGDFQVFQKK